MCNKLIRSAGYQSTHQSVNELESVVFSKMIYYENLSQFPPVVVVIEMREDLTRTVETGALGDTVQIGTATSTDLMCPLKTRYS